MASTDKSIDALPGLRIGDTKKIEEFNLYMIWVYARFNPE